MSDLCLESLKLPNQVFVSSPFWVELKMAFGRRCRSNANRTNQNLGLGFVRNTRSMSGKRIALLSNAEVMKKHCSEKMIQNHEKSLIESLPLDILIRILCGVDQGDLKRLFNVLKMFREAILPPAAEIDGKEISSKWDP